MDDQQRARELLPLPSKEVIDVHLPTGVRIYGYTKEQMQSYAADCVTAALRAAPEGFVIVPVEPTEEWVRAVIRTWQPNLKEGCKGWRELEDELLHWHTAMLAARPQGVKDRQPIDGCTESNCKRCRTHPNHRGDMEHAGIGWRPDSPQEASE